MQTVKTEAAVPVDFEQLHETVQKAYEAIGFPREIVGSWAISENDVKDFVSFVVQAQPKKILEVGTYVGVSTMLMALACPEARIFTVDPDLPLEVEMSSARSDTSGVNSKLTAQAVGRQAAASLGVAKRIQFVRGGFSVGDTFSTVMQAEGSRVEIVGPKLCEEQGPFDFIFVDGLHSADAVASDLELAAKALSRDGVIVLHDCIGYWGASVRSGVFRFLRGHPDFHFTHPAYSDIYKSVGVLSPRQSRAIGYPVRQPFKKNDLTPGLRATIARFNATLAGKRPVLEISFGEPVLADLLAGGDTPYSRISLGGPASKSKGGPWRPVAAIVEKLQQAPNSAVFSADFLDFAGDDAVAAVLDALKTAKAPLVLALTPPGETGVAGPQSRPIAAVMDLAEKQGLAVYSLPALDAEFERYALLPQPRDLGTTSLFTSFVVIAAPGGYSDGLGRDLVRLPAETAAEQEQLELQRVHLAAGYRRYYSDRNELLESNRQAGDRVKLMESNLRGLEADMARAQSAVEQANVRSAELASGAERNNTEALKLAGRFADLSESFRQFETQRLAQQEKVEALERNLAAEQSRNAAQSDQVADLEHKVEAERLAREEAQKRADAERSSAKLELTSALETVNTVRQELDAERVKAEGLAQQLVIDREQSGGQIGTLKGQLESLQKQLTAERTKSEEALAGMSAANSALAAEMSAVKAESLSAKKRAEGIIAGLERETAGLVGELHEIRSEYARTKDILSAAVDQERARAAEFSLMAIDVFETLDFADSTLQTQERLLGGTGEPGDPPGNGAIEDTFEELLGFRRRIARINDLLHTQLAAWKAQAASAQAHLDAMRSSTSWKLTAPLRWTGAGLQRFTRAPLRLKRRIGASLRGRHLVSLATRLDKQLEPRGLKAPVFDEHHYATHNMDIPAAEGMRHYLMFGEKEGRRPHRKFDPAFYVTQYPDVAASGVSPLVHFLTYGVQEGRSPCAELHPLSDLAKDANLSPLEYFAKA